MAGRLTTMPQLLTPGLRVARMVGIAAALVSCSGGSESVDGNGATDEETVSSQIATGPMASDRSDGQRPCLHRLRTGGDLTRGHRRRASGSPVDTFPRAAAGRVFAARIPSVEGFDLQPTDRVVWPAVNLPDGADACTRPTSSRVASRSVR